MKRTDKFKSPDETVIKKDMMTIVTIISILVLAGITAMLYFMYIFKSNGGISDVSEKGEEKRNIKEYLDSVYKEEIRDVRPEKYDEEEIRLTMTDKQLHDFATRKKDDIESIKYTVGYDVSLEEAAGKVFAALTKMSVNTVKSEENNKIIFDSGYNVGYNSKVQSVVNFRYVVEISRDNPRNIVMKYYYHEKDKGEQENLKDSYDFFSNILAPGVRKSF